MSVAATLVNFLIIPEIVLHLASLWRDTVMLDDRQHEQFTRLWTENQPSVAGYLHALAGDRNVSENLLQETALTLLRKFDDYDLTRPFLPWALGVARVQLLTHRRDAVRSRTVALEDQLLERFTALWAEVEVSIREEQAALEVCLGRLAPRAREVVRLRYFEALNATQVAERLGSVAGSVRVQLQRIREQLRECIAAQLRSQGCES